MQVLIIDELNECLQDFGVIDLCDLKQIVEVAEKMNMVCLSGLDISRDTYFNEKQLGVIKSEILTLKTGVALSLAVLDKISQMADAAIEEEAFLVFKI